MCTGTAATGAARLLLTLFAIAITALVQFSIQVQAGNCWSVIDDKGRCKELLAIRISKKNCCSGGGPSTAWTAEDLDSGKIFYWNALGGGAPNCQQCRGDCKDVECSEGEKCVIRNNKPKCVCAPDCPKSKRKGPICGTDGRTYRHYCQLLKRACRKKKYIQIAYFGSCQKSCKMLQCPGKKQCLLDQNHNPHCVRCSRQCPEVKRNFVCGVDGVTYNSLCHLRQAACAMGHAIPLAYHGKCKSSATCETIRCRKRKVCLSEPETGRPRCATCHYSCKNVKLKLEGPVCGTDNRTYASWCHMMHNSCNTRLVIETRHGGVCSAQLPSPVPTDSGAIIVVRNEEDLVSSTLHQEQNSIPVLESKSSSGSSSSSTSSLK